MFFIGLMILLILRNAFSQYLLLTITIKLNILLFDVSTEFREERLRAASRQRRTQREERRKRYSGSR